MKVVSCHIPLKKSGFGKRISKANEPAIWLAKVEVKEVMKNAKRSLELLLELKFLEAKDCSGEIRTMKPNI